MSTGTGRNAGDPLSRRQLLASHQSHTTLHPSQTTIRSLTVFYLLNSVWLGKQHNRGSASRQKGVDLPKEEGGQANEKDVEIERDGMF